MFMQWLCSVYSVAVQTLSAMGRYLFPHVHAIGAHLTSAVYHMFHDVKRNGGKVFSLCGGSRVRQGEENCPIG